MCIDHELLAERQPRGVRRQAVAVFSLHARRANDQRSAAPRVPGMAPPRVRHAHDRHLEVLLRGRGLGQVDRRWSLLRAHGRPWARGRDGAISIRREHRSGRTRRAEQHHLPPRRLLLLHARRLSVPGSADRGLSGENAKRGRPDRGPPGTSPAPPPFDQPIRDDLRPAEAHAARRSRRRASG